MPDRHVIQNNRGVDAPVVLIFPAGHKFLHVQKIATASRRSDNITDYCPRCVISIIYAIYLTQFQ